MSNTTQDIIINEIKALSESEAKAKLAKLMVNYSRIEHGQYTEKECMADYREVFREIVAREIFRKL